MMSFNMSNAAIMALKGDVSNANVQVVTLISIDTQQELNALMDRIVNV